MDGEPESLGRAASPKLHLGSDHLESCTKYDNARVAANAIHYMGLVFRVGGLPGSFEPRDERYKNGADAHSVGSRKIDDTHEMLK